LKGYGLWLMSRRLIVTADDFGAALPVNEAVDIAHREGILTAASLSFLGLGSQPPTPEWGAMLSDGRPFLQNAWWLSVFPGVMLTLTVLASNIVGDGLRDALDPRKVLKRLPG